MNGESEKLSYPPILRYTHRIIYSEKKKVYLQTLAFETLLAAALERQKSASTLNFLEPEVLLGTFPSCYSTLPAKHSHTPFLRYTYFIFQMSTHITPLSLSLFPCVHFHPPRKIWIPIPGSKAFLNLGAIWRWSYKMRNGTVMEERSKEAKCFCAVVNSRCWSSQTEKPPNLISSQMLG